MIAFACPHCDKKLRVKPELAGKQGRCPKCARSIVIPRTAPVEAATVGTIPPLADDVTLPPPDLGEPLASPGRKNLGHDDTQDDGPRQPVAKDAPPAELYDFLAPAQKPDELGRLGPYRVLAVLGAGGMGVVFKAEDTTLERPVALKAMLPGLAASASAKQRFLREAKLAASIEHDHIVPIYQVSEDRGVPFLAMQFLQGEPLDARLHRARHNGVGQPLPIPEVLRIGREMAEGLAAAHARDLIHRDIKPANVWLEGTRGRVKILDFGLARASSDPEQLTRPGAILGTPAYMAPEQARGEAVDARCDLFSLGCVLYQLTTGKQPFRGADTISTLMAVATENPPPPRELNPTIPAGLSEMVMRLLAKSPADRPQSARVVADALLALAQMEAPTQARLPAVPSRRGPEEQKVGKSRRWMVVGVAALLLAGVAAFLFLLSGKKTPSKDGTDNTPQPPVPLSPMALVRNPSPLPGVKSWTIIPRARPEGLRVFTWSPDSQLLATGGEDGSICLWEPMKGKLLRFLLGHGGVVSTLQFSPDGTQLASGGADNTVRIWDAGTGLPLHTLTGHTLRVRGLAWSPDSKRLASGSEDHSVRVWDAIRGQHLSSFTQQAATVTAVSWRDDSTIRSHSSGNNNWCIWDAATGKLRYRFTIRGPLKLHTNTPIVSRTADTTLTFWDAGNGKPLRTLTLLGLKGPIKVLAFSHDGTILVTAWESTIYFWEAVSGKSLGKPQKIIKKVKRLDFSRDDRFLVVEGDGSLGVRLIRTVRGKHFGELDRYLEGPGQTEGSGWAPKDKGIVARSRGTLCFWDIGTGKRWDVPTCVPRNNDVAWSPDGKFLASGTYSDVNCTVRLWNIETASLSHSLHLSQTGKTVFHPLAWSPDSKKLLTPSRNSSLEVWDASRGTSMQVIGGKHNDWLRGVAWSPNGKMLFSVQNEGWFWNPAGKPLYSLSGKWDMVKPTFSPDGKTLATVNWPQKVVDLWDAGTGKHRRALKGHKGDIQC